MQVCLGVLSLQQAVHGALCTEPPVIKKLTTHTLCLRVIGEDPASPMMRVVLVSHDTFLSEAQLICRHHFRHVVLDSQQQAAATVEQSMELAYTITGRPTMLLLRGAG